MKSLDDRIRELFRELDEGQKTAFLDAFENRPAQMPIVHSVSADGACSPIGSGGLSAGKIGGCGLMTQAEEIALRRAAHECIDAVGENARGIVCRFLCLFASDADFCEFWREAVTENGFPALEEVVMLMDHWNQEHPGKEETGV